MRKAPQFSVEEKDEEYNYLYEEIIEETAILRLIELKGTIEKIYNCASDDFELTELEDNFNNENYKINRYIYPFKPFYEYIDNVIDIMDEWACFEEEEDKEYENSEEYKRFKEVVHNRIEEREKLKNTNRNDKCPCGSGKKFKQCCLRKYEVYEELGRIFDLNIEMNKQWKEFCEKGKKEAKLKIENMEKVTE